MNSLQKTLIAVATGSLLSMGAQAAVSYAGQPYIGAKVGQYKPDVEGMDAATSYGVYGGYKFTNNFGIEGEYLTTSKTDSDEDKQVKDEYSADVIGLYGTYDYTFPNSGLYAKGRLGIAKNKIDVESIYKATNQTESDSFSDTGAAGGLGLGYNVTPMASIEAMYNIYPSIDSTDINGLTLGAHIKF